jgi:hypothetical protein
VPKSENETANWIDILIYHKNSLGLRINVCGCLIKERKSALLLLLRYYFVVNGVETLPGLLVTVTVIVHEHNLNNTDLLC